MKKAVLGCSHSGKTERGQLHTATTGSLTPGLMFVGAMALKFRPYIARQCVMKVKEELAESVSQSSSYGAGGGDVKPFEEVVLICCQPRW